MEKNRITKTLPRLSSQVGQEPFPHSTAYRENRRRRMFENFTFNQQSAHNESATASTVNSAAISPTSTRSSSPNPPQFVSTIASAAKSTGTTSNRPSLSVHELARQFSEHSIDQHLNSHRTPIPQHRKQLSTGSAAVRGHEGSNITINSNSIINGNSSINNNNTINGNSSINSNTSSLRSSRSSTSSASSLYSSLHPSFFGESTPSSTPSLLSPPSSLSSSLSSTSSTPSSSSASPLSIRLQRQCLTRMQAERSHARDISSLVQKMINDGDQCMVGTLPSSSSLSSSPSSSSLSPHQQALSSLPGTSAGTSQALQEEASDPPDGRTRSVAMAAIAGVNRPVRGHKRVASAGLPQGSKYRRGGEAAAAAAAGGSIDTAGFGSVAGVGYAGFVGGGGGTAKPMRVRKQVSERAIRGWR